MLNGVGPLGVDDVVLSTVGDAPPSAVTLAAIVQILLAATFLIMPVLVLRYGSHAQAAAEAEVVRQGFPATVLAQNGLHFDEGTAGLVLPVAIALGLGALAALNVVGNEIGRILTLSPPTDPPRRRWPNHLPSGHGRSIHRVSLRAIGRPDPRRDRCEGLRRSGHGGVPAMVRLRGQDALRPRDPRFDARHRASSHFRPPASTSAKGCAVARWSRSPDRCDRWV